MSIGEKIIAAIRDNKLVFDGNGYCTPQWQPSAAEQLEAVVEAHIEERVRIRLELDKQNDTARLNWLENADIMIQFNTLDSVRFNCPHFQDGMPLRWALDKGLEQEARKKQEGK